jgi:hypothetical protein
MIALHNNNVYKSQYLKNLDPASRDYAFYFLVEGAKKNYISCQTTLEKVYRNGYYKQQDIKKSDSLYNVLENQVPIGNFYKENRNNKSKVDRINN